MAMTLEVRKLACGYGNHSVIENISFTAKQGELVTLLGPNGVGKTTLFKTLLGLLPARRGEIVLDGRAMANWSRSAMALRLGYVPQVHLPPFPYLVRDVVVMGRSVHMGLFCSPSASDFAIADEALARLGLLHLKARIYTELSGGEQQMVLIARALTQQPAMLLLDEPTANLDFGNQIRVMEQIIKLAAEGLGVIMTTHSPDQAFLCASRVPTQALLLKPGGGLLSGNVAQILTESHLQQAYGVQIRIDQTVGLNNESLQICVPLLA